MNQAAIDAAASNANQIRFLAEKVVELIDYIAKLETRIDRYEVGLIDWTSWE